MWVVLPRVERFTRGPHDLDDLRRVAVPVDLMVPLTIVVATTKLVNGNTFLRAILPEVDNRLGK